MPGIITESQVRTTVHGPYKVKGVLRDGYDFVNGLSRARVRISNRIDRDYVVSQVERIENPVQIRLVEFSRGLTANDAEPLIVSAGLHPLGLPYLYFACAVMSGFKFDKMAAIGGPSISRTGPFVPAVIRAARGLEFVGLYPGKTIFGRSSFFLAAEQL